MGNESIPSSEVDCINTREQYRTPVVDAVDKPLRQDSRYYDLLPIMASMQSLTVTPPHSQNEVLAFCSTIQQQLYSLRSRMTKSTTDECCVLSALVYVDAIILNKSFKALLKSSVNVQLQAAIQQSTRAGEMNDRKEILDWITTSAAIGISSNRNHRVILIDKFKAVVALLEKVCI